MPVQRKPRSAQAVLLRTTQSRTVNWAFVHEPTQHQHRARGDRFQLGGRVGGEVEEGGRLKLFVHRLWRTAKLQEEEKVTSYNLHVYSFTTEFIFLQVQL